MKDPTTTALGFTKKRRAHRAPDSIARRTLISQSPHDLTALRSILSTARAYGCRRLPSMSLLYSIALREFACRPAAVARELASVSTPTR